MRFSHKSALWNTILTLLLFLTAEAVAQAPPPELSVRDAVMGKATANLQLDGNSDGLLDAADVQGAVVPGERLTPAQRAAFLDTAIAEFRSIRDADPASQNAMMVSWLQSQSDVADAGETDDGNVWAVFRDDVPFVVVNNFEPTDVGVLSEPPVMGAGHAKSNSSDLRTAGPAVPDFSELNYYELPASNQARVLRTLGQGYNSAYVSVNVQEDLLDAGWSSQMQEGTVQSFLDLPAELGVLLMEGHFSRVDGSKDIVENDREVWAFATASPASEANLSKYSAMIESGEVVPMIAVIAFDENDDEIIAKRLGITNDFVRKYLSFAQHSLVVPFACNTDKAAWKQAFLDAGAGLYAGWTQEVQDHEGTLATRHFFGRLLGSQTYRAEWDTGRVRPFEQPLIFREMQENQVCPPAGAPYSTCLPLTQDRNGSTLILTRGDQSQFSILRPIIRTMLMETKGSLLHIYGTFGTRPADEEDSGVYVGFRKAEIVTWDQRQIVVKIPESGSGSSGEVFVTVRGISSNTHMLSEYSTTLDYTVQTDEYGQFGSGSADIRFRYDVMPWRIKPDLPPDYIADNAMMLDSNDPNDQILLIKLAELSETQSLLTSGEADGSVNYSFGGTVRVSGCGDPGSVSGGGSLSAVLSVEDLEGTDSGYLFTAGLVSIDGPPRFVWGLGTQGAEGTVSDSCPENADTVALSGIGSGDIEWILAPDYSIPGGTSTDTDYVSNVADVEYQTTTWQDVTIQNPPDPEAAQ
ncbi:hypothetical protein KQI84_06660 [bacterium]|nr:hypothetical protein [bacterium]